MLLKTFRKGYKWFYWIIDKYDEKIIEKYKCKNRRSNIFFINDIIYDKDKDEKLLHNCLDLLIVAFEQSLKELGFKSIVVIGRDEMLDNSYKALGWKEDEKINKLIKNI